MRLEWFPEIYVLTDAFEGMYKINKIIIKYYFFNHIVFFFLVFQLDNVL